MRIVHRIILTTLITALILVVIWIVHKAGDYYLLRQTERPHHEIHKQWKPGGNVGHGLGIIGSAMMIAMFSYSLRKRVRRLRKWGRLPSWLKYHIFLGVAGPVFVTFHTSFKFGGLVSISYWSMVAVMLSGFIGRYIYVKIPRRVSGIEFSQQELKDKHIKLINNLGKEFDLSSDTLDLIIEKTGMDKIKKRGMLGVFTLLFMDITSWYTRRKLIQSVLKTTSMSKKRIKDFKTLIKHQVKMARQIAFWNSAHQLFHYWHVIHRPFAYTMVLIMVIHVIVAVTLGFTWVL